MNIYALGRSTNDNILLIMRAILGVLLAIFISVSIYLTLNTVARSEYFESEVNAKERALFQAAFHCLDWHIFKVFIVNFEIESKTRNSTVVVVESLFSYQLAKIQLSGIEEAQFEQCTIIRE